MGWVMLIWTLKLLGTLLNVLGSFEALKQKPKRVTALAQANPNPARPRQLTTADRARRKALKSQLITWTCWILILKFEPTADRVGSLVPLYDELKLILLLALIILRQPVAVLIFDQLICPLISPYEAPIDALGYGIGQLVAIFSLALVWPARRALTWWRGPQEPDVPAILAGLRLPNRPTLAHDLANSIQRTTGMDSGKPTSPPPPPSGQATLPRKAPATAASKAAAGGSGGRGVARPGLTKAPTGAKLPKSTAAGRGGGGRDTVTKATGTARVPASTQAFVYPSLEELAVVPRSKASGSGASSSARQDAHTALVLASLPSAPSTALVTYVPPPPPSAQQERVTLAIPPPPPHPSPPSPHAQAFVPVAIPTPPQPFKPARQASSSYASSLTDTPLPPGSFFSSRPKPTPSSTSATPPSGRQLVDSPARKRASVGSAMAVTPRQKALNAILDLSPELAGEGDGLEWGKRPAKKSKVSPVARATRRGRKTAAEGDDDYAEQEEEEDAPKRKKVATGLARSVTRRAQQEPEAEAPPPRKKVAVGLGRSTTRGAGLTATKAAPKRKPSGSLAGDSGGEEEAEASEFRTTRSARPTPLEAVSAGSRRSRAAALAKRESSPPPPTGSSETFSLPVPKRKAKGAAAKEVAAGDAPVAPARKARRVVLSSRVGAGSDEEIDGVPVARGVIAGRRSARK